MSINKHNYEAFFLDYSEGSLSAEKVAELLLFLEENPLLKEELENFDLLELDSTVDVSFNKEFLKIPINQDNVEEFIIGSIEGVNSQVDEQELIDYVNENKESKRLFKSYKNTILAVPDTIFPNKSSLKRKSRLVVLYPLIGIAASLLIFFMLTKNVEKQEYNPRGIIAIEKSIYVEDKYDVITNEIQIIQEKIEEESNNVARIQHRPVPEVRWPREESSGRASRPRVWPEAEESNPQGERRNVRPRSDRPEDRVARNDDAGHAGRGAEPPRRSRRSAACRFQSPPDRSGARTRSPRLA